MQCRQMYTATATAAAPAGVALKAHASSAAACRVAAAPSRPQLCPARLPGSARPRGALVITAAKGGKKLKSKSTGATMPKRQGKGFGRSAEEAGNDDLQHLQSLSPAAAAAGAQYFLFVRSSGGAGEERGRWLPMGSIAVAKEGDLRPAVQERQDILVEFVKKDNMGFRVALGKLGKLGYEFGYRLQKGPAPEDGDLERIRTLEGLDPSTDVETPVPATIKLIESGYLSKSILPQSKEVDSQVQLAKDTLAMPGVIEGALDKDKVLAAKAAAAAAADPKADSTVESKPETKGGAEGEQGGDGAIVFKFDD